MRLTPKFCASCSRYGAHYDVKADGKQAAQAFFDMPPVAMMRY